jgi:hypothetical protein
MEKNHLLHMYVRILFMSEFENLLYFVKSLVFQLGVLKFVHKRLTQAEKLCCLSATLSKLSFLPLHHFVKTQVFQPGVLKFVYER